MQGLLHLVSFRGNLPAETLTDTPYRVNDQAPVSLPVLLEVVPLLPVVSFSVTLLSPSSPPRVTLPGDSVAAGELPCELGLQPGHHALHPDWKYALKYGWKSALLQVWCPGWQQG